MAQVDRETERIQTFRSLFLSLDENGQETELILLNALRFAQSVTIPSEFTPSPKKQIRIT